MGRRKKAGGMNKSRKKIKTPKRTTKASRKATKRPSKASKTSSSKFKPVKRPGELREKLKGSLGRSIKRVTGLNPFTKTGKVNILALMRYRKSKAYQKLDTLTKQQINFAIVSRKWRK